MFIFFHPSFEIQIGVKISLIIFITYCLPRSFSILHRSTLKCNLYRVYIVTNNIFHTGNVAVLHDQPKCVSTEGNVSCYQEVRRAGRGQVCLESDTVTLKESGVEKGGVAVHIFSV